MSANSPYYQPPHTPDTEVPQAQLSFQPPHTHEDFSYNGSAYPPSTPTPDLYSQKHEYADPYQPRYVEESGSPPPPIEPYPTVDFEEKVPEKKKRSCVHFICCPCCCCFPMWLRCICCFILLIVVILAIAAGALAGTFKTPTLDMNGVTDDPNGLPRFQRSVEDLDEDMAFTVNLGLKIGINNPNIETLSLPSIGVVAYYPTSPNVAIANGEVRDIYINRYGLTNFTFPVHIHYNNSADPGFAMLHDIRSKCAASQDLSLLADITAVVSVIGIKIPLPTIRHTINFDCPVSVTQLPGGASS
ncbi:hypothetical protein BJV82DRAFT_592627 [Fennellomyces sp. T-0311]|nr:hypothetical protein BJV82DRAFT_592627 [Fennellomyces sp. T-0311]